ncbi:hypothetical protein GUG04_01220, partial [Xanthomonas citri pv. citri]|nr:hypothetical protein [Xanthomonas citri pv. citri]
RGNSQQAALTAAQATFEETDQLYRRQLSLVGQQLVAKSTVDTQRALRDAAQARVQQMRAQFEGVVAAIDSRIDETTRSVT